MNSNVRSALVGGLAATFVVAAAFAPRLLSSPDDAEVRFRPSSADESTAHIPASADASATTIAGQSVEMATTPTVEPQPAPTVAVPSTASTAPVRATTTRPPASTTTTTLAPSTTTTTLPAPTVSLTFAPESSSGLITYTTARNYDASICVQATLGDGSTSRFVNTFRGFAPPQGQFAVIPYPALADVTGMTLVNFNFAPPSYDPLPDPCAGH